MQHGWVKPEIDRRRHGRKLLAYREAMGHSHTHRRVIASLLSGLLLAMAACLLWPTWQAGAQPSTAIGSIPVRGCKAVVLPGHRTWCGALARPWGVGGGSLKVGFAVVTPEGADLADLAGLPRPPIVAMEGGPGYGSIDSGQGFADMLGPALDDRVFIVMDARGTGRSAAIDCPSMRDDGNGSIAACGRYLGERIGSYSSAAAADDLAAILKGLGLGAPVVYGDSYGTFLAQVFARRHPVTALILDGAYPTTGEDAWYDTQGPALRRALDLTCARDPGCQPGRTADRLADVLELIREQPRKVRAPGADGRRHGVTIDAPTLVGVAFNGTYLTPTLRELDAALGAALQGDWLPLGRLVAEFNYPGGGSEPVTSFSPGQMLAVACHDYPQLFDHAASTAQRRAQVRAAITDQRRRNPGVYAPFTIREYLQSDWAEQESCVQWPLRQLDMTMSPSRPPHPDVPVLVISGDLDTITTEAEGEMVADAFPQSAHLIVANGLHVNALGNPSGCAADAVRAFVADPASFVEPARFQTRPTCELPPIQLAQEYQATLGGLTIGQGLARTVADVVDRAWQSSGSDGLGLRGGRWSLSGWPKATITLTNLRLYKDLPVSGTITYDAGSGEISARLRADGLTWSGCWSALDGLGPAATAVEGDLCPPPAPTLGP